MKAIKKSYTNYSKMKTQTKITELTWERVSFLCDKIITKSEKAKNYNDELIELLELFLKKDNLTDANLMEYYSLEMHVLHNLINEGIKEEKYEICAQVKKVIQIEKELYLEWILAMTDEDLKDESLEEYNYTNLFFDNYNND